MRCKSGLKESLWNDDGWCGGDLSCKPEELVEPELLESKCWDLPLSVKAVTGHPQFCWATLLKMTAPWPRMGVLNADTVKRARWQMSPCALSLLRRSPKISAAVRYTPHPLKIVVSGYLLSWAGGNIPSFWKEVDGNNVEGTWMVVCLWCYNTGESVFFFFTNSILR